MMWAAAGAAMNTGHPATRGTGGSRHRRGQVLGAALLVALAVLAAYTPALHGDFIWDDDLYVYENRLLWEPGGLRRIWFTDDFQSQYFPLTITVFRWAYQLWGLDTLGYHLLNVAIHVLNSLLAWALLARLRVPAAWLAAGVFALHPVQAESVAWITELKNLLSTTFYLLAIAGYLRFEERGGARWYALAFGLFVLGLLSKTVVCTLPGVLLVLRWWRGQPIGGRHVALLAPFLAVGVGMGLFAAWYETSHIGTTGIEFHFTLPERLLIAGRAPWFYLGKLVFPAGLAFSYPRWTLDPWDPTQWSWPVALLAVAAVLWATARAGVGRGLAAALACFVVGISPMLGFVNYYTMRYSFVADHYQYLACLGPIAAACAGAARLVSRGPRWAAAVGRGLAAIVLVGLGALTWRQAHAYRGPEALWRDTIRKNPESWMAHNNLGNHLVDAGKIAEALHHYDVSRRLNPEYADPYNNIAGVLADQGRTEEALALFRRAIELEPGNADFHYNLAAVLAEAGRDDEAMAILTAVVDGMPTHHAAHNNLGTLLVKRGALAEAVTHFRAAVSTAARDPRIHENLADALLRLGDRDGAAEEYRAALVLAPERAGPYRGLAEILAAEGRAEDAISHYERAVALEPESTDTRYNLAMQLAAQGRLEAAVVQYREVLRRAPGDAEAANNLGVALMNLGRLDEAAQALDAGARLAPEDADIRYNLATVQLRRGRIPEAIAVARRALAGAPDDARSANLLAWILATTPATEWRSGAEAVRLAERANALTDYGNVDYLDTLAAAYAEAGRFDDAVRTARQALGRAGPASAQAHVLRERLARYAAGEAVREP
jgi:Flp pilus assembly protein TadD